MEISKNRKTEHARTGTRSETSLWDHNWRFKQLLGYISLWLLKETKRLYVCNDVLSHREQETIRLYVLSQRDTDSRTDTMYLYVLSPSEIYIKCIYIERERDFDLHQKLEWTVSFFALSKRQRDNIYIVIHSDTFSHRQRETKYLDLLSQTDKETMKDTVSCADMCSRKQKKRLYIYIYVFLRGRDTEREMVSFSS